MSEPVTTPTHDSPPEGTQARPLGKQLGERLRALRIAAGLTQTDVAGGRFSKEYISQIERGKTRPTEATVTWLADRLNVDPSFLSVGVTTEERTKAEALLTRGEALSEGHEYLEAIEAFRSARKSVAGTEAPTLEVRLLSGEAWALQQHGEVRDALVLLEHARELTELSGFSDVDRADVLFRIGVCRYKLSSIGTALALFDEALVLAERSGLPCDLLRADILGWRSRCHRRQRDYVAAHEDVERALELAQDLGDRRAIANTYFQASLIAQRQGHWVLSRNYAQRAKELYQGLNDDQNVGRLLLALGGLTLLLGDEDQAVEHLKASFARALEVDSPADAAQALGGLATVHLRRGEYDEADEDARKALALLVGREDFLHEVCPSQLVLGRALMERGRFDEAEECFRAADAAAEQLASISHRTEAWVALGDLAARRGLDGEAARLYRNAAEALQEIRF
ncbi:MAG: helix-turn-helix transcriptional regulator [Actinobacteria bacterium]|nr:MAG: helix-turn-helix transcriptional regulator [Actinomycetota bacterium]TML48586.1 MAG: helix-turn-helix transcriptional regulator [Actinomycetota bacterium]TML72629.1 MAG: helix-turn-helix transcriptional regulator [Actinomycetota bacterium]